MSLSPRCLAIMLTAALGCRAGNSPAGPQQSGGAVHTGIEGTVRRGPIQPVCQIETPCDAPFSAGFAVKQGDRVVTRFQSDTGGRFEVRLAPGTYTIVPDDSAPLMSPRFQGQQVTVGPAGLTHAELEFDTGIR